MNGTLQSLGWALIHFCWQATVIVALYIGVDSWLKNGRSQTRYLLALVTLSSMVLVFVGTLGYEALHSPFASSLRFDNAPLQSAASLPVKAFTNKVELLANGSIVLHSTALLPWLDGVWMLVLSCDN